MFLFDSLQLCPKNLNSSIIVFKCNPTDDISHKLDCFKVIASVCYDDKETESKVISQK